MRNRNTTSKNSSFEPNTIQRVWEKGILVSGAGIYEIRKDKCGAQMKRNEYGNVNSNFGWEIDHIKPVDLGGTDDINNLQPLQWENNRAKSNIYPWNCGK